VEIIRVDVHEKLALASVKEGQELNVSVVNYVSPESKAEPRQSRMDKAHYFGCLLSVIVQGCGQTLGLGLGQSKDMVVVFY